MSNILVFRILYFKQFQKYYLCIFIMISIKRSLRITRSFEILSKNTTLSQNKNCDCQEKSFITGESMWFWKSFECWLFWIYTPYTFEIVCNPYILQTVGDKSLACILTDIAARDKSLAHILADTAIRDVNDLLDW